MLKNERHGIYFPPFAKTAKGSALDLSRDDRKPTQTWGIRLVKTSPRSKLCKGDNMPLLKRNLTLHAVKDRHELFDALRVNRIKLDPSALDYALSHLSDDWSELSVLDTCSLTVIKNRRYGLPLDVWIKVIQCLFEFRNHSGIDEQLRRLRLLSHEKLDTILVILVAGRYHQRGFKIIFEPNGCASSDLLIARDSYRVYIEIKRENLQEHYRQQRIQTIGNILVHRLDNDLRSTLVATDSRIEIRLSCLCPDEHLDKIIDEAKQKIGSMKHGEETELKSLRGCKLALSKRKAAFLYEKGIHMGFVRVEKSGTPVPLCAPESMIVRCTFDMRPNFDALGKRIRKAAKQIKRDLEKDSSAQGLIVTELLIGNSAVVDAVTERFWPKQLQRFLGITIIADESWAIPLAGISKEQLALLSYAAIDI